MPVPKISGNLFNCAFNCALPTLLEKITLLARLEAEGLLPDEHDPVYISYKKLKTLFFQYYGLYNSEEDGLTWSNLNDYLLSLSFSDKEILFAPVFRCFIVEFAPGIDIPGYTFFLPSGYDRLNPEGVAVDDRGLDVDNGKYLQLDFAVMNQGFYRQFGISVALHNFDEELRCYTEIEAKSLTSEEDSSLLAFPSSMLSLKEKLFLYLKFGHYELQIAPNIHEYLAEIQHLPPAFKTVYEATSEDNDHLKTSAALTDLFIDVHRQLSQGSLLNAQNLKHYAENGRKFHPEGDEGTFTFSFILLTIGAAQGNENQSFYSGYLDCMSNLPQHNHDEANELARAIVVAGCNIDLLKQDLRIQEILSHYTDYLAAKSESPQEPLAISAGVKSESESESESEYEYNLTSNFQFNCMIGLLAAGAILLCVAIFVAFPPTLAAVPVAFGIAGSISLLASAGVFAYRQCSKKPATELLPVEKGIGLV